MIAQGSGGVYPYIELAKYFEHIAKAPDRALRYAHGALACALNMAVLHREDEKQTALIRKRIGRLKRKLENASKDDESGGI